MEDNVYFGGYTQIGGDYDIYVRKYNSSNDLLWSDQYDSGDSDIIQDMVVDSENNLLVFGSSDGDIYLVKYS